MELKKVKAIKTRPDKAALGSFLIVNLIGAPCSYSNNAVFADRKVAGCATAGSQTWA